MQVSKISKHKISPIFCNLPPPGQWTCSPKKGTISKKKKSFSTAFFKGILGLVHFRSRGASFQSGATLQVSLPRSFPEKWWLEEDLASYWDPVTLQGRTVKLFGGWKAGGGCVRFIPCRRRHFARKKMVGFPILQDFRKRTKQTSH